MQSGEPELTVVIPTYNRCDVLKKCVEALSAQTLPPDAFEVIISDDGSTDGTGRYIESLDRNTLPRVRCLRQPNTGANAARNNAVRHAGGRLLLFINDDTIATPRMLEEHCRTHAQYPSEALGVLGRVTISPDVPASIFAKLHLDASFEMWKGRRRLDWRAFYTCNVSVKRSYLLKYGLFDEGLRYHEDVELSERLSRHGFELVYNPLALGYHEHYVSEAAYLGTAVLDGKNLALWHRKAPFLKKEVAFFGFCPTAPLPVRIKHAFGDIVANRLTRPFLLRAARFLARHCEPLALYMYTKIYQAIKREASRC
jgi:glycosyltransferase involved in cell wall biosynthesis